LKDDYSEYPHFCTYGYAFNTKRPPVDNPLVRKAISAAIDRQLLIDAVNEGNGEIAATCTRPPAFGAVPPEEGIGIEFDLEQSQKWLAEAGYPGGKDFPELTILYRTSGFHKKIAEAVRNMLAHHLNIKLKLQEEEEEVYLGLIYGQGNPPHIFRAEMCSEYPDADGWLSLFQPSEHSFNTGWKNEEFVGLVDKAREISDPEKRKACYKRAEQILCEEDAVVLPLYFEIYHCMTKSRLKKWYHMPIGGQQIRNWSFEEK
jgi:ABC-type oligopeptide transport system substrate-binding subunit